MAALAPEHDPALLDAAQQLLAALHALDPGPADDAATALGFDPGQGTTATRPPVWPPPPADSPPAKPGDCTTVSAAELAALVRAGILSAAEVTDAFAANIERLDPRIHAFVTTTAPNRPSTTQGALTGVPVGLKDLIDTAGIATTCGSAILHDRIPGTDAEAWRRLRDAGAVLMGKLATQEFAAGVTGDNDHFSPPIHPLRPGHMCGGSSSGSAAAVAAGMLPAALGTDTGGSVRIPAACCGVVGLKPTYGTVSTQGVHPLAWSLDHVGPLTRTVRDAGLLLDVLAGTQAEAAARAGAHRLAPVRVGVAGTWIRETPEDIQRALAEAIQALQRSGATITEVTPPDPGTLTAVNRVITYAEGSAQHEALLRTDVVYGEAIRARQEAGRFILAGDYLTAQRLRSKACHAFGTIWRDVDVLLTPTLPCTAPPLDATHIAVAGHELPVGTALPRYTAPFNLTGSPAISIPYGQDQTGLPIGVQLVAPAYQDEMLCHVAASLLP